MDDSEGKSDAITIAMDSRLKIFNSSGCRITFTVLITPMREERYL